MANIWKRVSKSFGYFITTQMWLMNVGDVVDEPMKTFFGLLGAICQVCMLPFFLISMGGVILGGEMQALWMAVPSTAVIAFSMWWGKRLEDKKTVTA